jgi:hypothetical protein
MSFGLRILLEGVFALVPDSPFFKLEKGKIVNGKPKKATLLFPDLRSPGIASWSKEGAPVFRFPHWPFLAFDLLDYDQASTRPIDMAMRDMDTGREYGVLVLDHEYLEIAYTDFMQPAKFEPDLTIPENLGYPDTSAGSPELTSLWWVPQMFELSAVHEEVDRANDPSPRTFRFGLGNQLIAALTIERGRFFVRDFNRISIGGQIRPWDFGEVANGPNGVRRAIGNQLALELRGLESPVAFKLTHKEQGVGPSERKLILRPPAGMRRNTEVRLANMEPEGLRPASTADAIGTFVGGDPDFEPFYDLSSTTGYPRPVPLFPSEGGLGRENKPCAPLASQRFT